MKRIKLIIGMIMIVLATYTVSAMFAGNTGVIYHFEKCDDLKVNVTGNLTIDVGEYQFINCTELDQNYWDCPCYDGYDLKLVTHLATINTYYITMEYQYEGETEIIYSSGSGRGMRYRKKPKIDIIETNVTEYVPPVILDNSTLKEVIINKTINETQVQPPPDRNNDKIKLISIVYIFLLSLLLCLLFYFYRRKRLKEKQNQ